MDRQDGWPGLHAHYGLPQHNVFGLDHDLALRGIEDKSIDATELYTTDPEIDYYGLCILEDDLRYFPEYSAVLLYRADLEKRAPQVVAALARLEGRISSADMVDMNKLVKMAKVPESQVAAKFLARSLSLKTTGGQETVAARIWRRTKEHLYLVVDFISDRNLDRNPPGDYCRAKTNMGQGNFKYYRRHSDHSLPGPSGVHDPLTGYWWSSGHCGPFPL